MRTKLQCLTNSFRVIEVRLYFSRLYGPTLISILSDPRKLLLCQANREKRKNTETSNLTGTTLPTMYLEYQSRVSLMVAVAVTSHRGL